MDRRTFLRQGAVLGGGLMAAGPLHAFGARVAMGAQPTRTTGYGPLVLKGELYLPAEFNYQVISRQGQPMSDGRPTPGIFDGMAAFRGPQGTTILIRNHENRRRPGEFPVVVPPEFRYDQDPTYNAGCTKLVVRESRRGNTRQYQVVRSFAILGGTDTNCAGGIIPGEKWVTCEEVVNRSATGLKHGYSYEVDANADGPVKARPIVAAGRFVHEAVAWSDGILYQTEDRSISQGGACFYRYIPDRRRGDDDDDDDDDGRQDFRWVSAAGAQQDDHDDDDDDGQGRRERNLADTSGVLEALKLKGEFRANMDTGRVVGRAYPVEWVKVDEPDHNDDTDSRQDRQPGFTPTRYQAQDKGAAFFDRQEGAWTERRAGGKVYFDCTTGGAQNLGQVWEYDPKRETITLVFESANPQTLENPDNVVIVPRTGDIFLQEDSAGEQYIRGLTLDGEIYDFAKTVANTTEFCGGCFDPDGQTLYVNQQGERGGTQDGPPDGAAVTYAIYGPFQKREGRRGRGNGRDGDDD